MATLSLNKTRKTLRPVLVMAMACVFVFAATGAALMQSKKPITRNGLLEAVKLNGLTTQELIEQVERRGVNFRLTPADEAEFRQAGARPELLAAVRKHYRGAPEESASSGTMSPETTEPSRSNTRPPVGRPLSKTEIVTLLQRRMPPARVEQLVEVRGVDFTLTPEITQEITRAGGNRSLLGAISEKYVSPSRPVNPQPSNTQPPRIARQPVDAGPDYDDLTEQATSAIRANNPGYAVRLCQQAIRMDAQRPTAYQLLGFTELYGNRNIAAAEQSYRAALERGGAAVFRAYHAHDKLFSQYCLGSVFVGRSGVAFRGDNGQHSFEVPDTQIKEVALNNFVGVQYGAFHIKLRKERETGKKSETFDLAPYTQNRAESNLIMNLIQSYQ